MILDPSEPTGPMVTAGVLTATGTVSEPAVRAPEPIEYLGMVGFFALSLLLLSYILADPGTGGPISLAMVLMGYIASDLFSGLVHWGFDTWGSPQTPWLGPAFIHHFRVHHDDAKDITRHGFIATNGNNCLATTPVLAMACMLPASLYGVGPLRILLLAMCLGVFATNQCHKWAHQDQVSPVVAWLQRWHLILPADHHDVHHHHPYLGHYCITSGWLNRGLDYLGFFRGLERLITSITGVMPRENDLAAS